jgi:hypothetical protein
MTKKPNYEQITLISINSEFDLQQWKSKPGKVTTMRRDIPSACTKSIFADLYLEILTKNRSPLLMFGWEDKGGLVPVLFRGQMSSDFLQDFVCSCKGKSVCSSSCVCFEQNLSWTDLCPCYGSDMCINAITKNVTLLEDDGHDVWNLVDFYKALLL